MKRNRHLLFFCLPISVCLAGGGGENLILVVNPGDEQQVRIAAEYQRTRHLSDDHIVFVEPRTSSGTSGLYMGSENDKLSPVTDYYLAPVYNHIINHGLTNQIDYIATLGQPFRLAYETTFSSTGYRSFPDAFIHMDELVLDAGVTFSNLSTYTYRYTATGDAFKHETDGLYIGTALGYTGIFGNSPSDIISNFQRTAGADGTRPTGTVYFEENDDIRSDTREWQWPSTQDFLDNHDINYIEESDVSGATPLNRDDVRGAVIGSATYKVPNGSTYLPGSWADSLTSSGCDFSTRTQTKATELILAGVGGSGGTIVEPYAISDRFPNSIIFEYLEKGYTLGEAFYGAVNTPLIQLMLGDPLGQPYIDFPTITIHSGPADGATVSGTVDIRASAALNTAVWATDIDRLELYVDGFYSGTTTNSGTLSLNTATLSDGYHQLRLVAVNNAESAGEASIIRTVVVSNDGRSVSATGGSIDAGTNRTVSVSVSSAAGSGTLSRIELRHLGRSLGQIAAGSGNISLDATKLAYGTNSVKPVAVFSDGEEVAGAPVNVIRSPVWMAGSEPTPEPERIPGILGEYFIGQGGTSISSSTFNGPADVTNLHGRLLIGVYEGTDATYTLVYGGGKYLGDVEQHPVGSVTDTSLVDGLSARYTGRFLIEEAGEYNFFFYRQNDSARLLIDGQNILEINGKAAWFVTYYTPAVFLAAGEHTLELLAANTNTGSYDGNFDVGLYVRGPSGLCSVVDDSWVYQILERPVPEVTGYWRHEEAGAAAGAPIGTVINTLSPGTLDLTGRNGALYSSDIPGTVVYDPLTGTTLTNHFSLDASASNAQVFAENPVLINPKGTGNGSFTAEFFFKIVDEPSVRINDNNLNAYRIEVRTDGDAGQFGKVRAAQPVSYQNAPAAGDYVYVDTDGATGNPSDYTTETPRDEGDGINDDFSWHHTAMVYDGYFDTLTIYTDYQQKEAPVNVPDEAALTNAFLYGKVFPDECGLLIDEVRYTKGLLRASQFLRIVPAKEVWRSEYFGSSDDSGDAVDLADPDGDGIKNLMEFSFGLNPLTSSTGQLPAPFRSGLNVTYQFSTPPGVTGILYGVEYSTNLLSGLWESITDSGSGTNHLFVKPVPEEVPLYLRLRVSDGN